MKFRFQQQTCRGLWTSPGVFEADYADIVRMVDNGHRIGQPRAAVDVVTHLVIYAVDGDGKAAEATW